MQRHVLQMGCPFCMRATFRQEPDVLKPKVTVVPHVEPGVMCPHAAPLFSALRFAFVKGCRLVDVPATLWGKGMWPCPGTELASWKAPTTGVRSLFAGMTLSVARNAITDVVIWGIREDEMSKCQITYLGGDNTGLQGPYATRQQERLGIEELPFLAHPAVHTGGGAVPAAR